MARSIHGTFTWGTTEIDGEKLTTLVIQTGFAERSRQHPLVVMAETNGIILREVRKLASEGRFRKAHLIAMTGAMCVPQALALGLLLRDILDSHTLAFAYYYPEDSTYLVMPCAHSLAREVRVIEVESVVYDPDQRFFTF